MTVLPINVLGTSMGNMALRRSTTVVMAVLTLGTIRARYLCAFRKTEVAFDFWLWSEAWGTQ